MQGRGHVVARGGHGHHWSENGHPAGPPNLTALQKKKHTKNPPEQKRYNAEINALLFFLSSRLILSFVTYATSPIFATCWATPPSTAQDTNQRACILTALQWRLAANHWIPL